MKKLTTLLKEAEDTDKYLKIWADQTNKAAKETTTGRVGDKVFINHVAMTCDIDPVEDPKKYAQFKDLLVKANRAGYVSLARADFSPSYPKQDVEQSEIHYLTATWHFIRLK